MRLTFIFTVLVAATMISNLRSQGENAYRNALAAYSNAYNSVLSSLHSLANTIRSKFKLQPKKQALLDKDVENDEDREAKMKEFFEKIRKQLEEARKRREEKGNEDEFTAPEEQEISESTESSDSKEKKEL